jgi:hypothetical protein
LFHQSNSLAFLGRHDRDGAGFDAIAVMRKYPARPPSSNRPCPRHGRSVAAPSP